MVALSFASIAVHVMVVIPRLSNFKFRVVAPEPVVAPVKLYINDGVPQLSVAIASNSDPDTLYCVPLFGVLDALDLQVIDGA